MVHHKNYLYTVSLKTERQIQNGMKAKLEYGESNRNMLLFLVTFEALHNNGTSFNNEGKQIENIFSEIHRNLLQVILFLTDYITYF